MIFHFSMIIGKFYITSLAENSPPVHFYYNKVILFQEGPMVTQWPRQKAQWLSQRGLSWPWTALTRLLIQLPIFSGISSISTKLLNSSWRAWCQTQSQRVKVFRPLLFRVTGPSTCRNGQCKHQTQLCTTVLWVTQWHRAAGELSTNPECRRGSGCGQPCKGCCFSLQRYCQSTSSSDTQNQGHWNSWIALRRNMWQDSVKRNLSAFLP